jgi:hypothetical protein
MGGLTSLPASTFFSVGCLRPVRIRSHGSIRLFVAGLLVDPQLEVREVAASTVAPLIRDSPLAAVSEMRDEFVMYLRSRRG